MLFLVLSDACYNLYCSASAVPIGREDIGIGPRQGDKHKPVLPNRKHPSDLEPKCYPPDDTEACKTAQV